MLESRWRQSKWMFFRGSQALTLCGVYLGQCDEKPAEDVQFPQGACHGVWRGCGAAGLRCGEKSWWLKRSKPAGFQKAHHWSCHLWSRPREMISSGDGIYSTCKLCLCVHKGIHPDTCFITRHAMAYSHRTAEMWQTSSCEMIQTHASLQNKPQRSREGKSLKSSWMLNISLVGRGWDQRCHQTTRPTHLLLTRRKRRLSELCRRMFLLQTHTENILSIYEWKTI